MSPPSTRRALWAHLIVPQPLPARRGMLRASQPLFGLFYSFNAHNSKTGARVKFLGLAAWAGWRNGDEVSPMTCVSNVPQCHQTPAIQHPASPRGNLSPSPSAAIQKQKDLSQRQTQHALICPSSHYVLMTLAQAAPHPPLLSQSYIAQAATCLFCHRYG